MSSDHFSALIMNEMESGYSVTVQQMSEADLPDGDVTVGVEYSTLNYKDALVVQDNQSKLARKFPHVPGIDFAGTVESSRDPRYKSGDKVVLTGWRVGELHWGGYAQKARVMADWLVPLPDGLSTKQAMAIGTAGFTSMLCVMALEDHGLSPQAEAPVLVTGGAGGVGSVAVAILAKLGYQVAASTGRPEHADYLKSLGAAQIVARKELNETTKRPLESEKWAGCIDTVAGPTLGRVLGQMQYGASVAACGLASGPQLQTTVLPLLLRGVNILGIDSVLQPHENRLRAWNRLADDLPLDKLEETMTVCGLGEVPEHAAKILQGQVRGRLVVDVNR
jgi:acrylyl-CoA reductase (NADPH)